jgi:hypothetical protein
MSDQSFRERVSRRIVGPIEPRLYGAIFGFSSNFHYNGERVVYVGEEALDERDLGRIEGSIKHLVMLTLLAFAVIPLLFVTDISDNIGLAAHSLFVAMVLLANMLGYGLEFPTIRTIEDTEGDR